MQDDPVDAFILFNESESAVPDIVTQIEDAGASTHFWSRDIRPGQEWEEIEKRRLRDARTVVVFLGQMGWGPTHRRLAEEARSLQKMLVPVLLDTPAGPDAFEVVDGLFRKQRYIDFRRGRAPALQELIRAVPHSRSGRSNQFDGIVSTLVDGKEVERAQLLERICRDPLLDKAALAARLRIEITDRFTIRPGKPVGSGGRDPNAIAAIRSWMLSCIVWVDAEGSDSRAMLLQHVQAGNDYEPLPAVRYWTLAGLYQVKASYLEEALSHARNDPESEVALLAQAIAPQNASLVDELRLRLQSNDFHTVWQVLRVLRIVALPELAPTLCELLDRVVGEIALRYDVLYALAHPQIAQAARPLLLQQPGLDGLVDRVLQEIPRSNPNAALNFCGLLSVFEPAAIDSSLAQAATNPSRAAAADEVRKQLEVWRHATDDNRTIIAEAASDGIDVSRNYLDIEEDVRVLTAVMMAKTLTPPLAIGLFGDWGSGKSHFMEAMKVQVAELEERGKVPNSKFCGKVVQIHFNAWHYSDTHLLASLVSHIMEDLAKKVVVKKGVSRDGLLAELNGAKEACQAAEADKTQAKSALNTQGQALQALQRERQEKEVKLSAFNVADLKKVLDTETLTKAETALRAIGVPAAITSVGELSSAVTEARTKGWARIRAQALALATPNNAGILILLVALILLGGPALGWLLRELAPTATWTAFTEYAAQAAGAIVATATMVKRLVTTVGNHLNTLAEASRKANQLLAEKRATPTAEEAQLQAELVTLKAREQEAATRLSAAAARVTELEERIRLLNESESLAYFLEERTRSDDYRKHLGLVATIRRDFEALTERLTRSDGKIEPVDRIVLYIDDLDRCPVDKVLEVLQAVHLLLAYRLFVVVVGVDPRWLLLSLGNAHVAFQKNKHLNLDPTLGTSTPQHYLEKIFQIPFGLRPMSYAGYGRMINGLFGTAVNRLEAARETRRNNSVAADSATSSKSPATGPSRVGQETENKKEEAAKSTKPAAKDQTDIKTEDTNDEDITISDQSLAIQPWEARFAERLFVLIPSPRSVKRFTNIYRLLKASVRGKISDFEGTAELPGEFQLPMLLLAMLIGAPGECTQLFPKLLERAATNGNPLDSLRSFGTLNLTADKNLSLPMLEERIRAIVRDDKFPGTAEQFFHWLPRVSRFSFETDRTMQTTYRALKR